MFYLLLPSLEKRQLLIENLKTRGISAVFHYLPLHLSTMGATFGGKIGDCPVTEDLSDRLVRLPFYNDITEHDMARVVQSVIASS
jgi:dTDP-4-amino-4,6-dideoxygalactose transaminase